MQRRIFLGVMINILLNLWGCNPASASEPAGIAVVAGDFLYAQSILRTGHSVAVQAVRYQARADSYHNIPAWRIDIRSTEVDTVLYMRMDGGAPLYLKRTNHGLKRTVEIQYSLFPGEAHIYRRHTPDEDYQRKIRVDELVDVSMLPQLLLAAVAQGSVRDLRFKSIDYKSGNVYDMIAEHAGFKRQLFNGQWIRCAIFDIKVDSWLSAFSHRIRIIIPLAYGLANFVSYNGPAYSGSGVQVSLHLTGIGTRLAVNKK